MSSDSVSRHRSPAHQQPCRSMAQQGALVRGGGLRLRDQCSGGSLPDSRQRMLNECPANSQRGLVSEQEGRSRPKFSMYARIGQAGPRPLRALISGSVRCATPILLRACFPGGSTRGAPKSCDRWKFETSIAGRSAFISFEGYMDILRPNWSQSTRTWPFSCRCRIMAYAERGPNTRRRSSPQRFTDAFVRNVCFISNSESFVFNIAAASAGLANYALRGFSVDQQSSMRSSNGNALRSDIRHCSSKELAMPFKPSSLRLRGWDGEHPALIGFSENRLVTYLALAQGWCSECSWNRCDPGRSRGWSRIEATHAWIRMPRRQFASTSSVL